MQYLSRVALMSGIDDALVLCGACASVRTLDHATAIQPQVTSAKTAGRPFMSAPRAGEFCPIDIENAIIRGAQEGMMPKTSRRVLFTAVAVIVSAFSLANLGSARAVVTEPRVMPLGLPDARVAKAVLSASLLHHHPQWIDVPMGESRIHTFVIYPDLSGRLPVAVVTDQNQPMSDWARAVGTQVVNEGFITVVPDLGTDDVEQRVKAVREYFVSQPGSNGDSVSISFNWRESRIETAISTRAQHRVVRFDVTEHAWHNTLALLTNMVAV